MGARDRTAAGRVPTLAAARRMQCVAYVRAAQPADLGENEIEFVASTAQAASDGKIIREAAWQSSIERVRAGGRTPKVLAYHLAGYADGRQPVIGLIPPESIRIEPGVGLVHRIRFATEDVHPEGPRFYAAYRDGYLDAVSVGWDREMLAPESEWADRAIPEVMDLDWMETSCVPFGADEGAVKRARAAGQHDVAAFLTTLRDERRATWTAFAARVKTEGVALSLDRLRALCAGCADQAIERFGVGVQSVTVRAMPEALKASLAAKMEDPAAFMTQCVESSGGDPMAEQFCAWLCYEVTGAWPDGMAPAGDAPAEDLSADGAATDPTPAPVARTVKENHPDCPSEKPFALVDAAGKVLGCHDSAEAAQAQEQAIKAQEAKAAPAPAGAAADSTPPQHAWHPRRRRGADALSAGAMIGRWAAAPQVRAAVAKTFSQYLSAGDDALVTPTDAGAHAATLAGAGYALVGTARWPGFGFLPVRAETDALAVFADHPATRVLAEIDKFWALGERYAALGLQHRRGLLLHGAPGHGKTACLHLVRERLTAAGEVVIDATNADPWMLREALHAIREVEPERALTIVVEDVERWGAHGESELLALLDGQHSIGRCLLIASTNYRDQMSPRMLRPGRFDLHVEVGAPPAAGRLAYLTAKLAGIETTPEALAALVERTDGWSYSQLRELVIAYFAHGETLDGAVARIAPNAAAAAPTPEPPADTGLARLANSVEAFAADRADAAQDTRVMVYEIREALAGVAHALATLPETLAQRLAALTPADRAAPPTVTMRITAADGSAEDNERQRVAALLGDLTAIHAEAGRLTGKG